MDSALNVALRAIQDLLSRVGRTLNEPEQGLLLTAFDSLDNDDKRSIAGLYEPLWKGFFLAAAQGHTFVPLTAVKEEFGRSLEENYRGSSGTFLRFAATYWTLKLMQGQLFPSHRDKAVYQLLGQIEEDIASVFFPTPGPIRIATAKREEAQRALIKESGAPIDVEDFIKGNPTLKGRRALGCFGVAIILVVFVLALAILARFVR